ncbi:uncharacterized protein LOC127871908 [Dreissena polymorpha]|uniref:Galaxin-like repeats domain-containing protein n=1 Tax=Dreissena polymorpha TaxID=45954 RepID=A0A9D4LK35_DREPO|nr:uncharacterized protein LOC127871908 [Dreissena polymorpha]KAH3859480.1 hypothetical protein DPMN_102297 [Dreissena polymorpha]
MLMAVLGLTVVSANVLVCKVDNVVQPYDTETHVCCSRLHLKHQNGTEFRCCSGNILYNSGTHICCGSAIYEGLDSGLCCNGTMHDMKDTDGHNLLACCGNQVFFRGTGICCDGQFTRSPNRTTRMECRGGKGVIKQEIRLPLTKVNGGQPREHDKHDCRTAKTCRNDVMLDEFLPKGSAIKPGMRVLDGVKQCGQVVYPIKSSKFRYHCCDDDFYKTKHLDPKATFTWECCGKSLYNTSSHECCGGKLINTSLQPIGCCNGALEYIKSYQRCCGGKVVNKKEYLCHKPVKSSSGTLVRKQAEDHNNTCYDSATNTINTFNDAKLVCHKGQLISPDEDTETKDKYLLKAMQENIGKWGGNNHASKTLRDASPLCPFTECDTGMYNRTSECRKRARLDFFLRKMTKHNGRLVLSVIVTSPSKLYGTLITLNTFEECKYICFAKGILYSLYTNRLPENLPIKAARLSTRDIVVKTHNTSISCTIDQWAKRTEKSP